MSCRIYWKSIGSALLSCLLITSSVGRAGADVGESIIGGALLLGLGCATGAIDCNNKKRSKSTASQPRSNINSAARQQNRQVQTALNGFGWNVGSVDGVLGKNSRAAIRNYQGYMGYPQTGQLTDWERQNLVVGWQRFQEGVGEAYPRTMTAEGPRGLLKIGRDPNYVSRYGDSVTPNYGANQGESINRGPENGAQNAENQPNNEPQQPQDGQVIGNNNTVAPKLKPIGTVAVSAAARCELVDQTTRIQGGVILPSNMTDPDQALSEKFCEARGFAITQGVSVAAKYAVSENELTEFCKQIATEYSSVFSDLGVEDPDQVVSTVQSTAAQMGLNDPATMGEYGQICIGIGYRLDGVEVALAGALIMLAAGQQPYAELVGHHQREGFGVKPAPLDATQWYDIAMDALENGATPVFVPSTTAERIQVIRAALQADS